MEFVKRFIRNCLPRIYHFLVYIIVRYKWRGKLIVAYSSKIDSRSTFEGANKIGKDCWFVGSMGYGTYIGDNCKIEAHIGRFTSIAPHVETNKGVHPLYEPFVSMSPMFYSTRRQCGETFAKKMMFQEEKDLTIIGNDVWIGQNAFLVGGITIGDGAVILAGAVVTKDVEPYSIVGGVPAKHIKYRFEEERRNLLIASNWWNFPISWFRQNWELMCDMDGFIEYFSKKEDM